MEATEINTARKKIFLGILTTMAIFSFASCSRKISFLTSSIVPAARGYVKVKKDKNKNYHIKIDISELAEVNRVQPAKQTYVVWMITDQDIKKNVGQINSSTGLFSNRLKASFETVSSFKPIKIFITAEDDATIQFPNTQVVLSTDRF
jgi:hypothetical protein